MLKLDVPYDESFDLLGLACHKPDYQLCWGINKALGWRLAWEEDIAIHMPSGETSFARFAFDLTDEPIHIDVIANRISGQYLVPEYPQVDYILKAHDELERDSAMLIPQLRQAPGVLGVFKLAQAKIKNLDYLIFD